MYRKLERYAALDGTEAPAAGEAGEHASEGARPAAAEAPADGAAAVDDVSGAALPS
jgi:hypothetical protein